MKKNKSVFLVVIVVLLVSFAFFMDYFAVFQNMIYDGIYESEEETSSEIVIVGIDDLSYEQIGRWPYSREIQSQIFANILRDKPAVLGLDIIYDSKTNDSDDYKLLETLKKGNVVCASILLSGKEQWGYVAEDTYITPFKELEKEVNTGFINTYTEEKDNGVVRKTILNKVYNEELKSSFAYEIYKQYVLKNNINAKADKYQYSKMPLYIDYAGQPKDFENISAYMIYNGMIPEGFFENKIVLFGPYSLGMQDEYQTAINKNEKMFGVEVHANIIQNLIDDSFKKDISGIINLILIIFTGAVVFIISRRTKPSVSFFINLAIIVAYVLAGKYFYSKGYVFEIIYPLITIISLYVITLAYNYIEQILEKKRITNIFGKYVAPQIVDQILKDGEESLKLGGTRKYISVLFVDIRGFTPLSEKAEPEEVVGILNEYLNLCAQAIFNNGGTLDKFIGDATMAIYNAPLELENHAFYAIKTAWEMKEGAEPLMKKLQEKYDRTVQFGIGINTGYAVVGNIGSSQRMDYTAIGDTVNTSARLESNAKAGQILISKQTYEEVKDRIIATPLGTIKVKGKEDELEVFQVDGIVV